YGGAWMKFLWAMLDLATIVVLGSGLYLWVKRGRTAKAGASLDTKTDNEAAPAAQPALARSGESR
ncbi:MAG TPA: hypothetical protein DCX52_12670, partial [Massilia sp.]|nr:hypothetical protein [Massilia sp.]